MRRSIFTWLLCSVLGAVGGTAVAQAPPASVESKAMFDAGRQLASEQRYEDALVKFELAHRLAPSPGIKLNIGDCQEHLGRTASAWSTFRDAAAAFRIAGDEVRAGYARERAAALDGRLSRLTVKLAAGGAPAGLRIRKNGMVLESGQLGVASPVDPGSYLIEADAPGRIAWSSVVEVKGEEPREVEVPILVPAPAPPAPPPPEPTDTSVQPSRRSSRRIVALAVGGGGVALLGASVVVGLVARSHYNDANATYCHGTLDCDDEQGADAVNDAKRLGTGGTIVAAVGAAALITGVVLYLTAPREPAANVVLSPVAGPDRVGLTVIGGF